MRDDIRQRSDGTCQSVLHQADNHDWISLRHKDTAKGADRFCDEKKSPACYRFCFPTEGCKRCPKKDGGRSTCRQDSAQLIESCRLAAQVYRLQCLLQCASQCLAQVSGVASCLPCK